MLDIWNRGHTNPNGENTRKPLEWILIDSVIIALIAMCASMPSTIPTEAQAWVMFKAFLAAFFIQLAIERGLKKGS